MLLSDIAELIYWTRLTEWKICFSAIKEFLWFWVTDFSMSSSMLGDSGFWEKDQYIQGLSGPWFYNIIHSIKKINPCAYKSFKSQRISSSFKF